MSNQPYVQIAYDDLVTLVKDIFVGAKVSADNAQAAADVLVMADAQGISSHGVARTQRYLNDIAKGVTHPDTPHQVLKSGPSFEVWEGNHGLGSVLSNKAMKRAIELAKNSGVGMISVRCSSHHGITSYYTHEALAHDMIGVAMTNTAPLGIPTGGLGARFGTNPLAFAAPTTGKLPPFILDMATTNVTRGAVEIKLRNGDPIPDGWAIDSEGKTPTDAKAFLDGLLNLEGGLLPLGGASAGHKGYGLAMMVEIFTSLLCGGDYGINVRDTPETAACVNHFFMAIDIKQFRDLDHFKTDMDDYLQMMLDTKRADPLKPIYYAGQIPHANMVTAKKDGVKILASVYEELKSIANKYSVHVPSAKAL
ncbi:Ldh family oxidoreductase [Entomospira culicis]|uniref:Ldh family oxidoreductase n=1 Tax=Entomospira culicis TaxID=2719989 RepID=A0A968GIV1_9SPIO|nr:Ldh family oxidoreductase [Entomospira culicis]NIZ19331.1 Ldh family oxidoreductase [Entomospira culicis]NIZ69764.1 Ldh family oxidoreductase [Entomospira culicis]WDI36875.1 Ldh family oxidoreductase [Entomospira culicis]WDI38504.1 Ldh family oxidoreductase [Entomospira culicis]